MKETVKDGEDKLKMLERVNYQLEEQVKTFEQSNATLSSELEHYQEKVNDIIKMVSSMTEKVQSYSNREEIGNELPYWLKAYQDAVYARFLEFQQEISEKEKEC